MIYATTLPVLNEVSFVKYGKSCQQSSYAHWLGACSFVNLRCFRNI